MKRRAFLAAAMAAPVAAAVPAVAVTAASRPITYGGESIGFSDRISSEFAYAEGGSLPVGWDYAVKPVPTVMLTVIDADTGEEILGVLRCNAFTGELERYVMPYQVGAGGDFKTELITGNFAIVRKL